MAVPGRRVELTNWSKSTCSPCEIIPVQEPAGIAAALQEARERHVSVLPHGAGHSYTDAALNSDGLVIDVTPMRHILSWDPDQGLMRVEPGVTLRQVVQTAWGDGWWPLMSPSTPEVTMAGCAAMNVNGKNAWKCGPFGDMIRALEVQFPNGEVCTLTPEQDSHLFHAFIGSLGLLGIITSLTLQLHRIESGYVTLRQRPAANLDEVLALFAEEESHGEFLEAWIDGLASGEALGRGELTSAAFSQSGGFPPSPTPFYEQLTRIEQPFVRLGAALGRPALMPGVRLLNRAQVWRSRRDSQARQIGLYAYTFWPSALFSGYPALLPHGVETFQAFVPRLQAGEIFRQLLSYSQQQDCQPIWCVIKNHRADDYLLSYQLDGLSLELNYPRSPQNALKLQTVLKHMIANVVEAGGKFYLAKDHFLTAAQYRRSMGNERVAAFLRLKQQYDPDDLLQSDLYRRVFRSGS